MTQPLAFQLRPKTLDDYVGQSHLVGENGPIRQLLLNSKPQNLIFWGPPGVGKTSLALLLAKTWPVQFESLNATLANIADIKRIIEHSKNQLIPTLLFIDELHRFSKTQQDTLLSVVEDGQLFLIGATTENPRFSVIPGLVSRCMIFECHRLNESDLETLLTLSLAKSVPQASFSANARQFILNYARGDARRLMNAVSLVSAMPVPEDGIFSAEQLEPMLQESLSTLDDTSHYDMISALIKSLRGSDPDAALYWLARLLDAGEDPVFIARRLVIFSSEDIGNADPQALPLSVSAMQAAQLIGMPEIRITLSQVVIFLASSPKSNSAYLAIDAALSQVKSGDFQKIPGHLRSSGFEKKNYLYPHNYPNAMVKQSYWNESSLFYTPIPLGFEREIAKRLEWIRSQKLS